MLSTSLILLSLVLVVPGSLSAKTAAARKLDNVQAVRLDKSLSGGKPADHPKDIGEEKMRSILASLRFDKKSIILADLDDERLFDDRGIDFLVPKLARALREATPDQMVSFRYIKKAPHGKVIRNDRLISADCFVREGELFIKFARLYAKIEGDYERQGREYLLSRARDLRVSLETMDGQRTLSEKFIAVRLDHDF